MKKREQISEEERSGECVRENRRVKKREQVGEEENTGE